MRKLHPLALALPVILAGAPADAAQSALGTMGEVYRVQATPWGDVDPTGDAARDSQVVLTFEIRRHGAAPEREVIPGTDNSEIESNATLVYEAKSGATFVLWQTLVGNQFPVLNLASRSANGWSKVIELTGNPFSYKSAPQLLVTRDVSNLDGAAAQHRTVIHVAWAEENANGIYGAFYTPLILENGSFIGRNVVYRLAAFDNGAPSSNVVAPRLLQSPRLQPGSDVDSVRLVFGDADKGRIIAVEARVLPRGLMALGDGARAHIIGADKKLDSKALGALAATTRTVVLNAAVAMPRTVAKALAEEAAAFVQSWKPANGGLNALAAGARAHIIGVGSDFDDGLRSITGSHPVKVDEIAGLGGGPAHALRFTLSATWPAPLVDADANRYALFGSADGGEATVAWVQGDRMLYRESDAAGWGDVRELQLTEEFGLEAAFAMLAERTASR